MDTANLAARVERLERSLTRLRTMLGVMALALGSVALLAASRSQDPVVQARRFEVVNSLGHVSAVLGQDQIGRTVLRMGIPGDSAYLEASARGLEVTARDLGAAIEAASIELRRPLGYIRLSGQNLSWELADQDVGGSALIGAVDGLGMIDYSTNRVQWIARLARDGANDR